MKHSVFSGCLLSQQLLPMLFDSVLWPLDVEGRPELLVALKDNNDDLSI